MATKLITLKEDDLHQLQKKSLEMAKYIIQFCKEHNIRVYFFAGSLLGAVRHHGFIPWDDDIDMILPAPDFKRFVKIWNLEADTERYSLCLQTKDYNDHTLTASVRDNNTTFITDSTVDLDVNQGLAIDISPCMHVQILALVKKFNCYSRQDVLCSRLEGYQRDKERL